MFDRSIYVLYNVYQHIVSILHFLNLSKEDGEHRMATCVVSNLDTVESEQGLMVLLFLFPFPSCLKDEYKNNSQRMFALAGCSRR